MCPVIPFCNINTAAVFVCSVVSDLGISLQTQGCVSCNIDSAAVSISMKMLDKNAVHRQVCVTFYPNTPQLYGTCKLTAGQTATADAVLDGQRAIYLYRIFRAIL